MAISLVAAQLAVSIALSALMYSAWQMQRITGNCGWIDVFWTFGTGAAAVAIALVPLDGIEWPQVRQLVVAAFAGLWSLRLGWHLVLRTRKTDDDPRYRDMIRQWGAKAPVKLFWLLQTQALVGLLLAICIMLAARNPAGMLRVQDVAAILIFLTGIFGEAISDAQLRRFKEAAANRGQICDIGIWSWSRHPNYFFEWLCWSAYPLLAIAFNGTYPFGFLAALAPLCIYWLLTRVSGIPPLEAHMLSTRGAGFRAYQDRVSPFFPWPPRR
jgi:steroid 5-alpha reductase family enzyme